MSVDYTRTSSGETPEESESSMFAPTPVWDRGKKGSAARRSMFRDEPASEAAPTTRAAMGAGAAGAMASEPVIERESVRETAMSPNGDDAPLVAPSTRTTVRRDRNVAPAAVAVGLVALAGLAAAGWYATRPADKTLTPGGATPATSIAAAPVGGASDTTMAANTPSATAATAAATTPSSTTTTTTTHHVAATTSRAAPVRRTAMAAAPERSVTSRSATTSGVNTGTTSSLGVAPASPAVTPTSPPVNAMPAPAPETPAPSTTTPDVSPPATATSPTTTAPSSTPPQ